MSDVMRKLSLRSEQEKKKMQNRTKKLVEVRVDLRFFSNLHFAASHTVKSIFFRFILDCRSFFKGKLPRLFCTDVFYVLWW